MGRRLLEGWNQAARCAALQRKTWSDYSQTPLLSYLWLSHRRDREEETGEEEKKKKNLMMWLIGGLARFR